MTDWSEAKEKERIRRECQEKAQREEKLFFHSMPRADACDHDWSGPFRLLEDGLGDERTCTKCGMGAFTHSLRYGE